MKRTSMTFEDVVSAVFASILIGAVVGAALLLFLLGYSWFALVPFASRGAWMYIPSACVGFITTLYMLWLFLSDQLLPSEMWSRFKNLITGGID